MYTVIVADDEALEREYLKQILEETGEYCVVAVAATGEELVEAARVHRPQILLLDINMPGINGLEAARTLRGELPESVILLNSAYAEFDFAIQAVNLRLDAYLLKPSSRATILETLSKCLRERAPKTSNQENVRSACTELIISYIDQHYAEELPLSKLAAMAFFSPSHLSRIFNRECGMSINSYINQQRVAAAERLLKTTALPVREIALCCGFQNISHFNRVFHQMTGHIPTQVRKEN